MIRSVAFLLSLLLLFPVASIFTAAEGAVTADVCNGTVLEAPADIPQGKFFAGWGAEGVFLPAGATYAGEDAVLTAVFVGLSTRPAERIRTETKVGLRFLTDIDKADLSTLRNYTEVLFGTCITLADHVRAAGGVLTPAALNAAGTGYLETKTDKFYAETDTVATVAGSIVDVQLKNYCREFQAAGYIQVSYTDGTVGTVIAPACECVRLYDLALTAFADRTDAADETHVNAVSYGGYSAYGNDELTYFCKVLDCVVDIRRFHIGDDSENYRIAPVFYGYRPVSYTMDYEINTANLVFTVKADSAFNFKDHLEQVFVYIKSQDTVIQGSKYTHYKVSADGKTLSFQHITDFTPNQ